MCQVKGWWDNLNAEWKETLKYMLENEYYDKTPNTPTPSHFKKIESFDFSNTQINSLDPLAPIISEGLFKADKIRLINTNITDVGLLAEAKRLFLVDISGTAVKDVSMLKHIEYLKCDNCKDLDFDSLRKLNKLVNVSLRSTSLTSLEIFENKKKLDELSILGSKVSDDEVLRFKKLRPEVNIDLRPDLSDPLERTMMENAKVDANASYQAGIELIKSGRTDLTDTPIGICLNASPACFDEADFLRYLKEVNYQFPGTLVNSNSEETISKTLEEMFENSDLYKWLGSYSSMLRNPDAHSIESYHQLLQMTKYSNITLKQVETALRKSSNYIIESKNGTLYVKRK